MAACEDAGMSYEHPERLDELEFECEQGVGEEIAKMIEHAIAVAGQRLGLKLPLAGEGKTGQNWRDVH